MICYDRADDTVNNLLGEAIQKWHPELKVIDVGVLLAYARNKEGESTGKQPLKGLGGKAAAATVRLVSAKDRIFKKIDVEIILDGDFWKAQNRETQLSLLDHELEHILLLDQEETTDQGRPKLRLREDSFVVWGFHSIARRHGEHSLEIKALHHLFADPEGDALLTDKIRAVIASRMTLDQKAETLGQMARNPPSLSLTR